MKCPKCEIGKIIPIIFKADGEKGRLCDYCETMWLENQEVKKNTGQYIDGIMKGSGIEYVLDEAEDYDDSEEYDEETTNHLPKYS